MVFRFRTFNVISIAIVTWVLCVLMVSGRDGGRTNLRSRSIDEIPPNVHTRITTEIDTRNLSHKKKKKCKSIKKSMSQKYTEVETVDECKLSCKAKEKCLGYDYNGNEKECTIIFHWTKRKNTSDENRYCGVAEMSHFGHLIAPDEASEVVQIPNPTKPNLKPTKFNCPHDQSGLLDWGEPSTWHSGVLPQQNEDVILPTNSKILVRNALSEEFGIVTIPPSSELIFGAKKKGGTGLKAKGFDVQGRMIAGSESCLMSTKVNIVLSGTRPTDATTNIRDPTYKGISVTGTLDLHGKHFFQTWTRLARTVEVGDEYIILQNKVNWKPGFSVVLVTTAVKDAREWHQNEVLKVLFKIEIKFSNGEPGTIIYLESPAQYKHIANNSYQGEVGLLNRFIKVKGASDSEPSDPDTLDCTGRWVWGSNSAQCPELTGFGGHIIVHGGGKGYVEGVELYRMGQTNVLGRYPMHFHDLDNSCTDCYFKHSSVHRSYYRCVSIHGTNGITVTENVAYDITGYCYYLEDGVEQYNTISFNLAAHIHYLGEAAWGNGQTTAINYESPELTLPADVTASGFYITNVNNYIVGNAASGGWAGFAFPALEAPIGIHKDVNIRPSSLTGLTIDGNTAHSSGWWWSHGSGFYFGGALYLDENNKLVYNAGRDQSKGKRSPCNRDHCSDGNCNAYCQPEDQAWVRMTNSKVFLVPSVGLNSWAGRMEIIGFEAHDVGLSLEALESGFWIDKLLAVCRTGETWALPPGSQATFMKGDGFFWYDTGQEHIITNSTFRQCGYRSDLYDQYDTSTNRGCGDSAENGCKSGATVFGFLTHSDQFNPENMQATKQIKYESCGRRFKLHDFRGDDQASTVSGRLQNWVDTDGTASGLNEPTLIGSGEEDAGLWWRVDNEVVLDPQGPLTFIKQDSGHNRNIGHIHIEFDENEHGTVGVSQCGNGWGTCPTLGYIKHWGPMFENDDGLPVTANADIAGLTGGYGWVLQLNNGAPRKLTISQLEIHPDSPLLLAIPYPSGTSVTIEAKAAWCSPNSLYSCNEVFHAVASPQQVRASLGNVYHMSPDGLMTVRIVTSPQTYTGDPNWTFPDMETSGKWGRWYAINRFSRADVTLLQFWNGPFIEIQADCPASSINSAYCGNPTSALPSVCSDLTFEQVSFDKCCKINDPSTCEYA